MFGQGFHGLFLGCSLLAADGRSWCFVRVRFLCACKRTAKRVPPVCSCVAITPTGVTSSLRQACQSQCASGLVSRLSLQIKRRRS